MTTEAEALTRRLGIGEAAHHCTPVGLAEIAERLRKKRVTVDMWRQRPTSGFPPERWTVGGRPAWCWEHDIEPWAEDTGRLPD